MSFADYESLDRQKFKVSTPRSLEAVKRAGLVSSDLVFQAYAEFKDRELKFNGRNLLCSDKIDEEIL